MRLSLHDLNKDICIVLMKHFVTNFNLRFLPQGLALYRSMRRHIKDFTLWVVCMEPDCYDALRKLNLPFIQPINFSEFESVAYKALRLQRTIAEYCWTVNPLNPYLVFLADPNVQQVTYIDADMWFINSPQAFFDEFASSQKSVMISEHGYLPQYDQTSTSGQFCAQWITYRRNSSEPLRQWWEERCFEWCFNRYENGKFGDQKYLDDVPLAFPKDFFILENTYLTQGPWNMKKFSPADAVFFHFHGVRIRKTKVIISGTLPNRIYWGGMYFEYLTKLFEKIRKSNTDIFQFKLFSDSPLLNRNNIFRLINLILRRNLLILTEKKLRKSI